MRHRTDTLLDHEVTEHALAFQAIGIETERAGLDGYEEDIRLTGFLKLQFGKGDGLDLDTTSFDLAQVDRGGELGGLESVLLQPAGDDLQLIGLASFQLVFALRQAVVAGLAA